MHDKDLSSLIVEAITRRGGTATWTEIENDTMEELDDFQFMSALNGAFGRGYIRISDSGQALELTLKTSTTARK